MKDFTFNGKSSKDLGIVISQEKLEIKRFDKNLDNLVGLDVLDILRDVCYKLFNRKFDGKITSGVIYDMEDGSEVEYRIKITKHVRKKKEKEKPL